MEEKQRYLRWLGILCVIMAGTVNNLAQIPAGDRQPSA